MHTEKMNMHKRHDWWTIRCGIGLLTVLACTFPTIASGEYYVGNWSNGSIRVFNSTDNGNVAPVRTLSGAATLLGFPFGISLDTVNDELVVTTDGAHRVTTYDPLAAGNTPPIRNI